MAVAVAVLAGCSPAHQGAVTLDAGSGNPQYVTALCDGEGLTSLTLARTDDGLGGGPGTVLWKIEAATAQPVTSIVAGDVPDGFTETTPLPEGPLPEALEFEADHDGGTGGYQGQSFDLADLTSGTLLQNGSPVTTEDLDDHAEGNCGGLFAMLGLPAWTGWAILGVVVAAIAGYVVLLVRIAGRGRRARQASRAQATPPPWPPS